jgi:hypothetical protein
VGCLKPKNTIASKCRDAIRRFRRSFTRSVFCLPLAVLIFKQPEVPSIGWSTTISDLATAWIDPVTVRTVDARLLGCVQTSRSSQKNSVWPSKNHLEQ